MKYTLLILISFMFVGCSSEPMPNEDFISETANCEANGFASRTIKSSWDSEVIGVQCYAPRKFQPHQTEFILTDGTRCVMVSTPPATSRRAGSSGISCDWKD